MSILELKDVCYTYRTQYQQVEALKGISYTFEEGNMYAIMGKSGSGKTTLLSLMAGLDLPTRGEVLCEGVSTAQMNLERYRREKAAVIYQSFRLLPLLTVAENVMYPMELRGVKPRAAWDRAAKLVEKVALPPSVLDRYPTMLSGGEQQPGLHPQGPGDGDPAALRRRTHRQPGHRQRGECAEHSPGPGP